MSMVDMAQLTKLKTLRATRTELAEIAFFRVKQKLFVLEQDYVRTKEHLRQLVVDRERVLKEYFELSMRESNVKDAFLKVRGHYAAYCERINRTKDAQNRLELEIVASKEEMRQRLTELNALSIKNDRLTDFYKDCVKDLDRANELREYSEAAESRGVIAVR